MPETLLLLPTIENQLSSGSLNLGEENMGSDAHELAKAVFQQEGFELSDFSNINSQTDSLGFDAILAVLGEWKNVEVHCVLLNYPGTEDRHLLMKVAVPQDAEAYLFLNQYKAEPTDTSPSLASIYTESIAFKQQQLLFSSLDFTAEDQPLSIPYPVAFSSLLAADMVKAGINGFEVTMDDDIADLLTALFDGKTGESLLVPGAVYAEEDEMDLFFEKVMNSQKTTGPFTMGVDTIRLGFPLDKEAIVWPDVLVTGSIEINSIALAIEATLSLYNKVLFLSFTDFPTLGDFLTFIGLSDLTDNLELISPSLLSIQLTELEIVFDLNNNSVSSISLNLVSQQAFTLFGDFISLSPSMDLEISDPFDPEFREVSGLLEGIWRLGSTNFETSIDYPGLNVIAKMGDNQILDVAALTEKVLSGADLPEIAFTEMNFQGNLRQKSFSVGIEGGTNWGFSLAGRDYAMQDIALGVDYEEEAVTEAFMNGGFVLGGLEMEVSTQYALEGGWTFSANTAEGETANLSVVATEILEAFDFPADLPDLLLEDINLFAVPSQKTYTISCKSADPWEFIKGFPTLEIEKFEAHKAREEGVATYQVILRTILNLGDENDPINLHLFGEYASENKGMQFSGTNSPGQPIPIGRLLQKFGVSDLPGILADLEINSLHVDLNTATKEFHFSCETSLTIDANPADLSLQIDIIKNADGYGKAFSGELTIGSRVFSVDFESKPGILSLEAAYTNEDGESLNLVEFFEEVSNVTLGIDSSLTTLILYQLQLNYEKSPDKKYGIIGDFAWKPSIPLIGDLDIRANVDLVKESKVTGTVCGKIEVPIPDLEFLTFGACYRMEEDENENSLVFQLEIGRLTFEAEYSSDSAGNVTFEFGASGELSLGEMLTFFASLADPSIDDFEFDPPWNILSDIPIGDFISGTKLKLEIKKGPPKKKIFSIAFNNFNSLVPDVLSPFITIHTLGLEFESTPKSGKKAAKKSKIILDAEFLGGPRNDLAWDPINEAPPEIPGKGGSVFDLRYMGLGQHVAFTQASRVSSIKEVMDLLRGVIDESELKLAGDRSLKQGNPLALFGDNSPIAFSPESEWLVGLDVSLLKTLSLSIIFNDPVIYGLRIELYGEHAKNFAGLEFEILYQKISPTIGKYHIDLVLPDYVRHLQFGAVSVTLPCLVLDIFTNGDFKVDLGFPWNFNYERSFALEVFPFTGAGGFYFNKLSAATATSTPLVPVERGVFTPVYEFGLGLKIGLGKSFNKGPLKAEISITVQGIIEGVISWYNPSSGAERVLYYKIRGGVAIVGRLYGEVDFEVVSVSVEVIAEAKIVFLIESYAPILIELSAKVSVKAKAKVLFVTVKFSFSLTVTQSFTIDSPDSGTAPWLIE